MSADRCSARRTAAGILIGLGAMAAAAQDEPPDMEFLEYLGSWEQGDADWLLFEPAVTGDERQDPGTGEDDGQPAAAANPEATESKDES